MCVHSAVYKIVHIVLAADLVEKEKVGEKASSSLDGGPHGCPVLVALAVAAHWVCHKR